MAISSACVTSLPQLVTALVVFYGGLMVRNGDITAGDLVSFLLYLQSLSDAFSSIGYIFASLTQAVGAADKGEWMSVFWVPLCLAVGLISFVWFVWIPLFAFKYMS